MNAEMMILTFKEIFQHDDFQPFFSPGRINLIGEHTDYNGGYVFPCAITFGTYGLSSRRTDRLFRVYSLNFPTLGIVEFDLDTLEYKKEHEWANYPKGMIRYLIEAGCSMTTGMDILVYGNIPNGAGLSSSASLEMLIGVMVENLYNFKIDRIELVKIGKRVENEFMRVNSGIMDQFAIGMGKRDCAILLDCQTLQYQYAPIKLAHHKIIIMNTNKRRELSGSNYNLRRTECENALEELKQVINVESLGDLTVEGFEAHKNIIGDKTLVKRAKHAVYENQRTVEAYRRLMDGDLLGFGQLMNESHISLRDDFEVTGRELDTLVEAAWQQQGVVGARMTGAGFGGCAIAIVKEEFLEDFIQGVGDVYKDTIGYEATFYVVSIGNNASVISNEDFMKLQ